MSATAIDVSRKLVALTAKVVDELVRTLQGISAPPALIAVVLEQLAKDALKLAAKYRGEIN